MTWQENAACKGLSPDLFFPEPGHSTAQARLTCLRCPVREECLESAIANNEPLGIWGGRSLPERLRIKKARAADAVPPAAAPAPPKVRRRRAVAQCGTYSGYKRHQRYDERPCDDCTAANAAYRVDWLARQRKGVAQ